jgi:hypothetical protein
MLGEAFDWVEALAFAVGLGTSIHPDELFPIPATALSLSRKKLPVRCHINARIQQFADLWNRLDAPHPKGLA